jgi:hypothetical protein
MGPPPGPDALPPMTPPAGPTAIPSMPSA